MREHRPLSLKEKRLLSGLGLGAFLILMLLTCYFAGRPLIRFAREPELFRQWVDDKGLRAHVLFLGMVILQVIVAIIPGEPLEIAAGYAYGAVEGTLLCDLGAVIGSVLVFLLVRRFGTRAVEVFFSLDKLNSLRFLQDERRLHLTVFFLFFLPGTPKDVLCYFVGLTKMPLKNWIVISAVARLPSIITSTVGGNALGTENYVLAFIVFAATLLISGLGLLVYRATTRRKEKNLPSSGR